MSKQTKIYSTQAKSQRYTKQPAVSYPSTQQTHNIALTLSRRRCVSVLYGPSTAFSYLVLTAKYMSFNNCVRYNLNGTKDAFSILMWFVARQLYFSYLEPKVSIKPSTDQQLCVFILPRWAMAWLVQIQAAYNDSNIFGPWNSLLDMGTSSHWELIIAPGQETNKYVMDAFSIFYKIIAYWGFPLESSRWSEARWFLWVHIRYIFMIK